MGFNKTLLYTLTAIVTLVSCMTSNARLFMSDKIEVTIKVHDESGKPIPYVTVWQFLKISPSHTDMPLALTLGMADLWRITERYKQTSEFISTFGETPIPRLIIPEMGDSNGNVKNTLDYAWRTGIGNHYPRPNPTNFGYTFIKHGYLPERLEFNVPTNKSKVEAIVTLKRDPNEAIENAAYIQTYERLRYELSDTSKNEAMTVDNQRRIAKIEKELEHAAQQAIAAGDNKAAARIYIRMRYLPTIALENGITEFNQVNRDSARSKRAWGLAKQLDPDNLFIWIHTIQERAGNQSDTLRDERIKNVAVQTELLIEKYGLAVWPVIYDLRAGLYANINQKERSILLYREAAELEPKYKDWSKQ